MKTLPPSRSLLLGLLALGMGYGIATAVQPAQADKKPNADKSQPPPVNPTCIQIRSQAPYRGYGYDHIVEIHNACDKPAICTVKTDVNPTAVEQSVAPGESRSVLMFRGSPSSAFTPTVSCKLS